MINRYILTSVLVSIFILSSPAAQGKARLLSNKSQCLTRVTFYWNGNTCEFCLSDFNSRGDSCSFFAISFKNLGIKVNFSSGRNHLWKFEDLNYASTKSKNLPVNISFTTNQTGNIVSGSIVFGKIKDSLNMWIVPARNGDIPVISDSTKPLDYDISLSRFLCNDTSQISVFNGNYPVGYRRKDPVLNYPEISAFHWGGSVKMATSASVQNRGDLIVNYHVLHPEKLKFDDPELLRKREIYNAKWESRHPPKKKKRRTKPPLLKFKPL